MAKKKEKMVELKAKQPKKKWVRGLADAINQYMFNNQVSSSPVPKIVVTIGKKKAITIKTKAKQLDILDGVKLKKKK